jgi:DeoR family transcriptional regulator of aga operon
LRRWLPSPALNAVRVDGVTVQQGITTFSETEAFIAKLLMERSLQTIAVFDHTKVGKASLFGIATLSSLHGCITDQSLDPAIVTHLHNSQVELYIANLVD